MNENSSKKLLTYLAAGAALTAANGCKEGPSGGTISSINPAAAIINGNLQPGVNTEVLCLIDFDGDNQIDVAVRAYNYVDYLSSVFPDSYSYVEVYGINGSAILSKMGPVNIGGYRYDYPLTRRLDMGFNISEGSSRWIEYSYSSIVYNYYGKETSGGKFLGKEGFVGVKFISGGNTHYGWFKLTVAEDGRSAVVSEAAFELVPGVPIKAGSLE